VSENLFLNKLTRRRNIKYGQVCLIGSPHSILPNADDAFLKHFKNDYKPISYHLNYNWNFILAYLGD
jgi:hypothetical protein